MPRPPDDVRISLETRGGPTHRIERVGTPFTRRFRVRRNGRKSAKLPEATASSIAAETRRWLSSHAEAATPLCDRAALAASLVVCGLVFWAVSRSRWGV